MILRREFFTLLGGAAAWPLSARARQRERMRRIGVLMAIDENDPEGKYRYSALTQALADLGWTDGGNLRMDVRGDGGEINLIRVRAQELVGLQPDMILVSSIPPTLALQRETRTIPIIFVIAGDPVASGIVARLDRPNGNVTGFAAREAALGGKWLELLSEIGPASSGPHSCSIQTPAPDRFFCPHLRWRPGRFRSHRSLPPFIATWKSKRPWTRLGASREAALSSCRMHSRSSIDGGVDALAIDASVRQLRCASRSWGTT